MCLVMVPRGNGSQGIKRPHQTFRLGQLPSSQWREKRPHGPLSFQCSAPPLYLYLPPIKVWGAAYQTDWALWCGWKHKHWFQQSCNSLFVPFSHSLSALLNVYVFKGPLACTSGTVAGGTLRAPWPRWVVEKPSGFLFHRFDIDLLAVHGKIREHQLPELNPRDNRPPGHQYLH